MQKKNRTGKRDSERWKRQGARERNSSEMKYLRKNNEYNNRKSQCLWLPT